MKKLIAIMLAALFVFGLAACGSINEAEVSVLWADLADIKLPGSLVDSMDKEMYLENINYAYYDANNDQSTQLKQAEDALNNGCIVLMVELVNVDSAQEIVDMAKAKNVPVIFMGCDVDDAVVSSYDKCACVHSAYDNAGSVLATNIVQSAYDDEDMLTLDQNGDGKVSYVAVGEVGAIVDAITAEKADMLVEVTADLGALKVESRDVEATFFFFFKTTAQEYTLTNADGEIIEMIITDKDTTALEVLASLQAVEYNKGSVNKYVPVYTIGSDASAKEFTTQDDELTAEENALFVFGASELVDSSMLAGTVIVDTDTIAASAVAVAVNYINGTAVENPITEVPYIAG